MHTTTLIEKLEKLGYSVQHREVYGKVSISSADMGMIAIARTNQVFQFNTDYLGFAELSNDDKETLYSILVEYSATPVEDREEQERFVYEMALNPDDDVDNTLKLCHKGNNEVTWAIATLSEAMEYQLYQFTDNEIKNLPLQTQTILKSCNRYSVKVYGQIGEK